MVAVLRNSPASPPARDPARRPISSSGCGRKARPRHSATSQNRMRGTLSMRRSAKWSPSERFLDQGICRDEQQHEDAAQEHRHDPGRQPACERGQTENGERVADEPERRDDQQFTQGTRPLSDAIELWMAQDRESQSNCKHQQQKGQRVEILHCRNKAGHRNDGRDQRAGSNRARQVDEQRTRHQRDCKHDDGYAGGCP